MTEFKKFEIDPETFEDLYKKAWNAYFLEGNRTPLEDFRKSLEKTFFDVKAPFDIEKWNRCTVKLPIHLDCADLIIRKVGVDSILGVNATNTTDSCYIGWHIGDSFSVSGDYEEAVQDDIEEQINEHPEDWEYRVIPFK